MKTRGIGLLAALAAGGTLSALGAQFTTAHVIDAVKEKVLEVDEYGVSEELVFRIKAPAFNCARRLKPINFVLNHKKLPHGSGPAVEMVWFQKTPQNAAPTAFGVE